MTRQQQDDSELSNLLTPLLRFFILVTFYQFIVV